jgi:nickel/cobalt transporter (NicO) family protein
MMILALSHPAPHPEAGIMTSAVLFGAGSGALHAVTGPDHVLSLGPMVIESRRAPWRIGASWGLGHAAGTLVLSLPVLYFAQALHLPLLASIGDRLAGVALIATAAWSYFQARRGAVPGSAVASRNAIGVGFIHGLTGAASLMLVLPMVAAGSPLTSAVFLLAFALGSTLGMAILTSVLARVGSRLEPRIALRSRQLLCAASAALGLLWLFL